MYSRGVKCRTRIFFFERRALELTVVALEDLGGLDAFPGGAELDEHAGGFDPLIMIKRNKLKGLLD